MLCYAEAWLLDSSPASWQAVLDYDQFNRYLKPHPYWFTILREPVSRSISSFNYFAGNRPMTWSGMMDRLGGVKHVASQSQDTLLVARFGNSLAYDLGWYDFVGHHGGTAWDHDKGTIQAFVSQLDTQFDLVLSPQRSKPCMHCSV